MPPSILGDPLVIETHEADGVQWVVSLAGSNPSADQCFQVADAETAHRLAAELRSRGVLTGTEDPATVYLIGINKPSGVEIVGVFATEEAAVAECHTDEYFVSPQVMGVAQPYEPTTWNLGAWYPTMEGRRNTAWRCSACEQEGSLHVPPGTSALDSIPMVRHCHDHQSPDCRVEGSRRIAVRRLDVGHRPEPIELDCGATATLLAGELANGQVVGGP